MCIRDRGITLIRIREKPLEKISENDIVIPHRRILLKKDVDSIIHQIRNLILFETYPLNLISNYLNQKEFQNEEHFEQYSKQLPIPVLEVTCALSIRDNAGAESIPTPSLDCLACT